MKNIGEVIREIRESRGITRAWLAKKAGVDYSYLYKLEAGRAKGASTSYLERIAQALGVPLSSLLKEERKEPLRSDNFKILNNKYRAVPIYGRIPAGTPREVWDDYMEQVIYLPDVPEGVFGLIVSGDSSIDEGIDDGDIVLINPYRQALDGDIVAVCINGDEFTLKKFISSNNYIILAPANQRYKPLIFTLQQFTNRVNIIGVMIGYIKKTRRWHG